MTSRTVKFIPHNYQKRAIDWIVEHPRCLLFLDMGLGKTVSTLTAIAKVQRYGEAQRVLVIAPKTVAETTWSTEVEKWEHLSHLRVSRVIGTIPQREGALKKEADLYVIGRDTVPWLVTTLGKQWPFDMVVIDELTSFKNPSAIRFKALKNRLPHTHRVVGLTGTPTPNGLLDLWAQVYCIDQGERLLPYVTRYRDKYFHCVMHNHIPIKIYPRDGAQEEIMRKISDITLSMQAKDWLEMPPIIYEDVPVEFPPTVMEAYNKFVNYRVMELKDGGEITASSAAVLLGKLSQYCNGYMYFDPDEQHRLHEKWQCVHTFKMNALKELVELFYEPVLIFYQHVCDKAEIIKTFNGKIKNPKTIRVYKDANDLSDWNDGKIDILLAHPASTAFGLNMQRGGSVIVWYSTGWNLELYQQANARLHRQGQTRPVRVFNLVVKGTVDERMLDAIKGKERNQQAVMKRLAREVIDNR